MIFIQYHQPSGNNPTLTAERASQLRHAANTGTAFSYVTILQC